TELGSNWWKITTVFNRTGTHCFCVEFYSEGTMGGDGFAVARAKLEAIGVTLDEALNEEGGTLQFSGPEEGGFIPAYDEATDRYIGMPAYAFDPENEVDMEFTFDSGAEVNDWTFIDADSSGHSFVMDDPSPYVGFSPAFGSNSLLSGPLFENGTVTPGGVDNWAITPTFTVPVGGNAGSGFSLLYAAASALYHETLELWVLPEGELENAVLIDSVTAETGSWESIGCSLIDYQGQTVAIGMRHCTAHNACGLIIDEVYLSCEAPHYARVSFSRSMRVTDELKYDLRVDAFGRDEISGNIFVTVYEDGVNIDNYDGQSLFANYGENWRTCYTSDASSNGRHTYTFVFSWLDRTEPDFRIYLDNVGIVSVAAPIDLIVVTDYDVPEAGTLPGDNEPSVPAGCGYYIDTVVWFGEDEYAMSDDEVFEAGGSYDLLIRVFAEDGYAFPDDVQLYVENDPGAEILWLSEEYAVIMFSEVTIPAASGLPGDANGDGILSSADLSALFAYVMNAGSLTEQGLINADVNGDGLINTVDVTILSQLIFGN
ncbi:MAG: dockerin type I repeat-containing protein, partial [Clostridia bacterium]|nr:dockerin type I repeat-containing protein [Clostridia bacterium]